MSVKTTGRPRVYNTGGFDDSSSRNAIIKFLMETLELEMIVNPNNNENLWLAHRKMNQNEIKIQEIRINSEMVKLHEIHVEFVFSVEKKEFSLVLMQFHHKWRRSK
jgi:hypothetical protein